MDLKARIEDIVNENLENEAHFLVDIIITVSNGPKKVLILLDGDEGINIDNCAKVSRVVGHAIEEEELISDAFRLEVSSPGLDHPITLLRQYEKNVGRKVKITLNDGLSHAGKLLSANKNEIEIEEIIKKEKNKLTILFKDILKTEVLVSF